MNDKDELIDDDDTLPFDPTPHDDITACIQAMGVIEDLDPLLLSDSEGRMVEKIKKMSLVITYQALREIFEANQYGTNKPTQG